MLLKIMSPTKSRISWIGRAIFFGKPPWISCPVGATGRSPIGPPILQERGWNYGEKHFPADVPPGGTRVALVPRPLASFHPEIPSPRGRGAG